MWPYSTTQRAAGEQLTPKASSPQQQLRLRLQTGKVSLCVKAYQATLKVWTWMVSSVERFLLCSAEVLEERIVSELLHVWDELSLCRQPYTSAMFRNSCLDPLADCRHFSGHHITLRASMVTMTCIHYSSTSSLPQELHANERQQ